MTRATKMSTFSAMSPTAGSWMTADEIAAIYAVSPETLALYRQRGTLPSLMRAGRPLYDAATAASIFRRRGVTTSISDERSFGRLGVVTLGSAPLTALPGIGNAVRAHATR
jgi:hypothetical protein